MSKIVRFYLDGQVTYGLLDSDLVYGLVGDVFGEFEQGAYIGKRDELKLLSPCDPTKVVGVGLNYKSHVEELGMGIPRAPLLFLKPPSSVIGPASRIIYPSVSNEVMFEAELAAVMQRRARSVVPHEAQRYVLGYTCANDVTARDLVRTDSTVTRGKCFDTFCPLGPCIATGLDATNLAIRSRLNGAVCQQSSTREMLSSVSQLVSYISQVMTLEPGDVILTGTPKGAGILTVGDLIEVEIEGIGSLVNRVVSQREREDSL